MSSTAGVGVLQLFITIEHDSNSYYYFTSYNNKLVTVYL